jgi:hypothetical protein
VTPTIAGVAITRERSRRTAIAATIPRGSEVSTCTTLIAMKEVPDRKMPMSFCPAVHARDDQSMMAPATQVRARTGRIPTKTSSGNRTGDSRMRAPSASALRPRGSRVRSIT